MYRPTGTTRRGFISGIALACFAVVALVSSGGEVFAQALVPPRGVGSIGFHFQKVDHTGVILTDGFVDSGRSVNQDFFIEGEYGVTDRLAVSLGLPYVFSKYLGGAPPAKRILPIDQCQCWHSGFQDLSIGARYNVLGYPHSAFKLTPSILFGVPSHDYDFRGEAVLGRNLRELQLGIDASERIDAISEKFYLQGHYSYGFVERVLDLRNDRSKGTMEGDFLLTRKLSVRGVLAWQHTHGGLRAGSPTSASLPPPGELNTLERMNEVDRLLRDNYWRAGAGTAYSFPKMEVFFDFIKVIGGSYTHTGGAVTLGVRFPLDLTRPESRKY
jgi:hypothetical protein